MPISRTEGVGSGVASDWNGASPHPDRARPCGGGGGVAAAHWLLLVESARGERERVVGEPHARGERQAPGDAGHPPRRPGCLARLCPLRRRARPRAQPRRAHAHARRARRSRPAARRQPCPARAPGAAPVGRGSTAGRSRAPGGDAAIPRSRGCGSANPGGHRPRPDERGAPAGGHHGLRRGPAPRRAHGPRPGDPAQRHPHQRFRSTGRGAGAHHLWHFTLALAGGVDRALSASWWTQPSRRSARPRTTAA